MRVIGLLLLPVALAACAPLGTVHTSRGSDRLRTALTMGAVWSGERARVLLLSNSVLSCGPPEEPDPDALTAYDAELPLALTREGSIVLAFALFSDDLSDWSGSYPVDAAASPWALDVVEPRAALAAFNAVWEAQVSVEDGLYREYTPVEWDTTIPVPAPGTLHFEDEGDEANGTFSLDSLDVSGAFHAEPCPPGQDDLLNANLLAYLESLVTWGDPRAVSP